jgi:hypothetical protein
MKLRGRERQCAERLASSRFSRPCQGHFLRRTIQGVRLDNFLSFAPGSDAFDLQSLNVLIGPNGSGKSNLIEAFEATLFLRLKIWKSSRRTMLRRLWKRRPVIRRKGPITRSATPAIS